MTAVPQPGRLLTIADYAALPEDDQYRWELLEGNLTELRPGGYTKSVGPGGFISEARDVEHWAENRGATKVVLIGIDIVKP